MNKDVVIQILQSKAISSDQLNNFITDFIKDQKDKDIVGEELSGILQLLTMGIFNLRHAASLSAIKLNLNVINVFNKTGVLVRTDVYDKE